MNIKPKLVAVFLTFTVFCASGGALVLECDTAGLGYGIGTSVQIPPNATAYTIECWVKPTESISSGQYNMFGQFQSVNGRMFVGYYNGKAGVFNGGGTGWTTGNTTLEAGIWHHIAFVVDCGSGTAGVSIYLDGELDGSASGTVYGAPDCYFTFGPNIAMSGLGKIFKLFKGRISDVRVWSVARTQAEIKAGLNSRLVGTESKLIGYWPLDAYGDRNEKTILDARSGIASVLADHYSLVQDDELPLLGKVGFREHCLLASSSTLQSASVMRGLKTDITASLGNNFTIEVWARPMLECPDERWLLTQFNTENGRFVFATTDNKPSFFVGGSTSQHVVSPNALDVGEWTHLALTRNGDDFVLYTNGFVAVEENVPNAYSPPATPFCIGTSYFDGKWGKVTGGAGYPFVGHMREVRVWDSCRTAVQIRETMTRSLSGAEEGLVGYWPLDKGAGTNVMNRVTGALCGNVVVAPAWEFIKAPPVSRNQGPSMESAATFAGDCHSGADTGIRITTADYTIEGWLRIRSCVNSEYYGDQYAYVASQYTGKSGQVSMMFGVRSNRLFHFQDGAGWIDGYASVPLNRWVHVAVVKQGTSRRLYLNGVLDVETTDGESTIPSASVNMQLGSATHDISLKRRWGLDGSLADVRFWNCARTAGDIAKYRTRRMVGREPGLVGYWPLDEGTGTTLVNHAKGGSNGEILAAWDTLDDLSFGDPIVPGLKFIIR